MRSYHQNIWMSKDICLANDMILISFQSKFMTVISPNIYVSKFGSQEKKLKFHTEMTHVSRDLKGVLPSIVSDMPRSW